MSDPTDHLCHCSEFDHNHLCVKCGAEEEGWQDSVIAQLEAQLDAVRPYMQHLDTCRVSYRAGKRVKPCGCGLDAILRRDAD
jgi:hypothetical protein